MSRSIPFFVLTVLLVLGIGSMATAQDFILRESDPNVVQLSNQIKDIMNVFEDSDGDGLYDALTINGRYTKGDIRASDAQGFQFEDGRYIVLYPTSFSGLPQPGQSALLGFMHYFDEKGISTYLALVAEQATGDDTTHGLGVYFYDSSGLRVGAPSTMFMEKAQLRALPIYQQWVQMGEDFGIGTNPVNSQFFVFAKDLGLTDVILIVIYQLYQ